MKSNIQDLMTLHENFIKHLEKSCHLSFWNYSKNCRRKKTSKLIVWAHHHPDTKSTWRYLKKRKSRANIIDQHKCKTPQQNTSSPYTTIYLKYHISWHHPYGRKWRGTKQPLDESDSGEWKVGLKLNIQKTKIMASGPVTSWEIDGETVETVSDYFFGLQNHCRWWLQPWD